MKRLSLLFAVVLTAMSVTGCSCWSGCYDRTSVYFETCPGCHEPWHPCAKREKKCQTVVQEPVAKCEKPTCSSCNPCPKKHRSCSRCERVVHDDCK